MSKDKNRFGEAAGQPVEAIIVGAGHRGLLYASYSEQHPEQLRIVGVVDPDPSRRKKTAERFGFSSDRCWASVGELTALERMADVAINGTMDQLHVETTLPLLHAGYDVLLEKPIGVSEAEVLQLQQTAKALNRKVVIGHVLRYAPFYAAIRQRIEDGEIGEIVSLQTTENVSYHHMATAFVRGKWNSLENCQSTLLMAKCCHDLDLIVWMKSGVHPVKAASFGSLMQFRPEKAPAGAGTRCLADCPLEAECTYSARKMYVDPGPQGAYAWDFTNLTPQSSEEEKLESLRTDNPYGRCVWRCDNDVVDHQAVIIEFGDNSTATHNLVGATSRPCRSIHIIGTRGEIQGVMEEGRFVIRHPDYSAMDGYSEEWVELDVSADMHGGGDMRLVADFLNVLRGGEHSLSSTSLDQSILSHQIGFAADRSRLENRVINIEV